MHWLIVNTEAFSSRGQKGKKELDLNVLPRVLLLFLKAVKYPYIILDESSRIKSSTPMAEWKKSTRCRAIKLLQPFGERTISTGTLKSKSPLNMYDQYGFLDPGIFPETMFEFAERYCVMVTIRVGRGRRVCISQKDYDRIRNRLINSYRRGGEAQLNFSKSSIFKEMTISDENLEHIIAHKEYTPFIHQDELIRRVAHCTTFVKREDLFDVKYEHFVHNPIKRYVELTDSQRSLHDKLIELGFTDNLVLGKAAALDLRHRLQDVYNGFEPIEHIEKVIENGVEKKIRTITYKSLEESPKLDDLMELLDEIDTDENQVAVFCTRNNLSDAAYSRIIDSGISAVRFINDEKKGAEEEFESGAARVFFSSLRPAAFGLNCLRKCDYAIYICLDDETEAFYQSRHRILRGQLTHAKFAYIICTRGTIEERTIRSLEVGTDLIDNNSDRSVFELEE